MCSPPLIVLPWTAIFATIISLVFTCVDASWLRPQVRASGASFRPHRTFALLAVLACAAGTATGPVPTSADARPRVYFTDYDSRPQMRPVIIDGSPAVRAGPFHSWRGWGTREG